jgi:hypothetical protein
MRKTGVFVWDNMATSTVDGGFFVEKSWKNHRSSSGGYSSMPSLIIGGYSKRLVSTEVVKKT